MKYYKVKGHAGGMSIPNKKGYYFVANELHTVKEVEKLKLSYEFIRNHLESVEINKFKTFWFFGARFKCKL